MAITLTTLMANGRALLVPNTAGVQFTQLHMDVINKSPTALAAFEWAVANDVPITISDGGTGTSFDPARRDRTPNGAIVIDASLFPSITTASPEVPARTILSEAVVAIEKSVHEIRHGQDHNDGTPFLAPTRYATPAFDLGSGLAFCPQAGSPPC